MLHTIPKEYCGIPMLMTIYNNAFKEGYYQGDIHIVDQRCLRTEEELEAYAQGLAAGKIKRKSEGKR